MCLQNLMRRKARTLLTVLGVVIGSCAIIIMISIGVGMKESQEKLLSQMGDLTVINVTPVGKSKSNARLDDKAIGEMKKLEGVLIATPKLSTDNVNAQISLVAGRDKRFVCDWSFVSGIEPAAVKALGYKITEGTALNNTKGAALVGEYFAYNFRDTKRPDGYNMVDRYQFNADGTMKKPKPPYFDPMETPMELVVTAYVGETEKTLSYPIKAVGRLKEDYGRGMETSEGLVMNMADLKKILADARRLSGLKPDNSGYPTVIVKTRSIGDVARVEEEIKRMGFGTYSMESIRKPLEKEARQKQMVLGGLGAISLIVAALGITNTMIMSISERTKEIGVMKALGCFVKDIRAIFLMEAGCIGFIGGVVGIVISLLISTAMNLLQSGTPPASIEEALQRLNDVGNRLSVVPPWLLGFSLLFSVLIGLGSGYYPANKAVRISALEAIKHD